MPPPTELPTLLFPTPSAWAKWLRANHQSSDGIWMQLAKKNSTVVSLTYNEALEEALCWGWIDGQKKSDTAHTWLQRFTPRRKNSMWSKINCGKAEALIDLKRMRPAGLLQIESAKKDGRWARAYEPQSTIEVPADFARLLAANPHAAAFFKTINSINRYAILHRLQTAKKPETRQARIEKFVAMLAEQRLIYP